MRNYFLIIFCILPAVFFGGEAAVEVTSSNNDGYGTLRYWIEQKADHIYFDTIREVNLTESLPVIERTAETPSTHIYLSSSTDFATISQEGTKDYEYGFRWYGLTCTWQSISFTGNGKMIVDSVQGYTPSVSFDHCKFNNSAINFKNIEVLAHDVTFASPSIILDNAIINFDTSVELKDGSITLIGNNEISVDGGVSLVISDNISGTGSLEKTYDGDLELLGTNSYTGGTIVSDGELIGNTDSICGNIINNAMLRFTQENDGTYSGTISGEGAFFKDGMGLLNLTGNFSQHRVWVVDGILAINNVCESSLMVYPSGILRGCGTILGNVYNSGTVTPGNSIGTLTMKSYFAISSEDKCYLDIETAPYNLENSSATHPSGCIVAEDADLSNSYVVTFPTSSSIDDSIYVSDKTYSYEIVKANVLIAEDVNCYTFDGSPCFSPTLQIIGQSLFVNLKVNNFADIVTNDNAKEVAKQLDKQSSVLKASDDMGNVINNIRFTGADWENDISTATLITDKINQLYVKFKEFDLVQEKNNEQMNLLLNTHLDTYLLPCTKNGKHKLNLWFDGAVDITAHHKISGDVPRYRSKVGSVLAGIDYATSNFIFGPMLGYSNSNLKWGDNLGAGSINSLYFGFYNVWKKDIFYVDADILAAYNWRYCEKRNIEFMHRQAQHRTTGWQYNIYLNTGFVIKDYFFPFISADYTRVNQNSLTEFGADSLNLHVRKSHSNLVRIETGVKSYFPLIKTGANVKIIPFTKLAYAREIRFGGKYFVSNFVGQQSTFLTKEESPSRNLFVGMLGLRATSDTKPFSCSLFYGGEFGRGYLDNSGNISLDYVF